MAIFNKFDKQSGGATIIAKGTKLSGDIELECTLHIDGIFDGTINSKSMVTIGKSGVVNGEVFANKVMISGSFSGVIDSEFVEILAEGRVFGKVIAKEFMIEKKGLFEGESRVKNIDKNTLKDVKTINIEQDKLTNKNDVANLENKLDVNKPKI